MQICDFDIFICMQNDIQTVNWHFQFEYEEL